MHKFIYSRCSQITLCLLYIASEQAATEATSRESCIKYIHCRYEIAHSYEEKQLFVTCVIRNLQLLKVNNATHVHTQDGPTLIRSYTRSHILACPYAHTYFTSRAYAQSPCEYIFMHRRTQPHTHVCVRTPRLLRIYAHILMQLHACMLTHTRTLGRTRLHARPLVLHRGDIQRIGGR